MLEFLKNLFCRSLDPLSYSGHTDTGRVRSHNEDTFCMLSDRNLFAVADGMGGHNAGEVASQVAVDALDTFCSKEAIRKIKGNREEIRHFLIQGFHHINKAVIELAQEDISKNGMGCTLVTCLIDGSFLHTCHVGDARCYVAGSQGLDQLTRDHSALAFYNDNIEGNEPGSSQKPLRQVITRAIGFPFSEDPEYHCREISPGTRLLLCSDGLWSMVDDEKILEVLLEAETTDQAAQTLIQKANQAGGTDNITAVVVFC